MYLCEIEKEQPLYTLELDRDDLLCPIAWAPWEDPVLAADGFTYTRNEIEQWLKDHDTSPTTGRELSCKLLIPNRFAKTAVGAFDLDLEDLCCPITSALWEDDPVLASDGFTYSRKAIEAWFKDRDTSPKTREKVLSKALIPNHFAKIALRWWKDQPP